MLLEISRVLKNKGYYICVSYGDPDIRFHYFDNKDYNWIRLAQTPYKVFKPNIDESEKKIIFDDKNKERNKDYYHYIYILEKGSDIFQNIESHINSSNLVNTGPTRSWFDWFD